MVKVYKDPNSDNLRIVYVNHDDDGPESDDPFIYELEDGCLELNEIDEIPGDWIELVPETKVTES